MTALDHPLLETLRADKAVRPRQVYLVGGAIRDALLGRTPLDFDFAVRRDAMALARRFAERIKGAYVPLHEEFGCARVVKKRQGQAVTFDFAEFRGRTLRHDLLGRDFTINAMALDVVHLPSAGDWPSRIQDPLKGRDDLENRRLRMTTAESFRCDPLRLMRAYALSANLSLQLDPVVRRCIAADHERIREVSAERIRDELFKICAAPRAAVAVKAMHHSGLLDAVIPQVTVMYGVEQGGYHHLDVWRHSLETVVQMDRVVREFCKDPAVDAYLRTPVSPPHTRRAMLTLAALLHDIGKPRTRRQGQDRLTFHGHEHAGREIVRTIARQLKFSGKERRTLETLVLWHLRPGYLSNFAKPSQRMFFRYFRDTGEEAAAVALLSLADQRSTRGPMTTEADQRHHEAICRDIIQRYFARPAEDRRPRLLSGHDVMTALKVPPSPLIGQILRAVEEQQAAGGVMTREEALGCAKKILEKSRGTATKGRA